MNLNVFTLFDKKASVYLTPFFMRSEGDAIRACISLVDDPATNPGKWPEDFHLVKVAEFDDQTGVLLPQQHQIIVELSSLKANNKRPTEMDMRARYEAETSQES